MLVLAMGPLQNLRFYFAKSNAAAAIFFLQFFNLVKCINNQETHTRALSFDSIGFLFSSLGYSQVQ